MQTQLPTMKGGVSGANDETEIPKKGKEIKKGKVDETENLKKGANDATQNPTIKKGKWNDATRVPSSTTKGKGV